jgi:hypothetical protein
MVNERSSVVMDMMRRYSDQLLSTIGQLREHAIDLADKKNDVVQTLRHSIGPHVNDIYYEYKVRDRPPLVYVHHRCRSCSPTCRPCNAIDAVRTKHSKTHSKYRCGWACA